MDNKRSYGKVDDIDTIEITLEDLEDVPEKKVSSANRKVYGTVNYEDTIVITLDDLKEEAPKGKTYGSVPDYTDTVSFAKKGKIEQKSIIYPSVLGLAGGFLAFLINEPFSADQGADTIGNTLVAMGLFLGIIGALISGALACSEDVKQLVPQKAMMHFGSGALWGFVSGFFGGIIAQFIYAVMSGGGDVISQIIARIFGWAVAGGFVGLSQSMAGFKINSKKLKNGLLGGLIGGAVGGLLFDPISLILGCFATESTHGGWLSRCVGITVMGCAIGYAIGFISESLKEAWIYVTEGPIRGKQFILYEDVTSFGSSPKCSITLVKDQSIAPCHFRIENHKTYYSLVSEAQTFLNGRETGRQNLKNGDIISAGNTSFRYEENIINKNIQR